jgi:hypothetical protein
LKTKEKLTLPSLYLFLCCIVLLNSCKKETSNLSQIRDTEIAQAKGWYEKTYIKNRNISSNLKTSSTVIQLDFSQLLDPEWESGVIYNRFNKAVIEIPIKDQNKFSFSFNEGLVGNVVYKKENSRSSFLLYKNGTGYDTYLMTIIADDSYLNNDRSKLDRNTYKKHDVNFSGIVLYFTAKGKFINSWGYKDGKLVLPIEKKKELVNPDNIILRGQGQVPDMLACTDYYLNSYTNGELTDSHFLYRICDEPGGGSGGGSGAGAGAGNGIPIFGSGRMAPIGLAPGDGDGGFPLVQGIEYIPVEDPTKADHALDKNKLPPNNTTDKQFGNTCVFKTMEWVSKFVGGNKLFTDIMKDYANKIQTPTRSNVTILQDLFKNGVPAEELNQLVSTFFETTTTISIPKSIDAGNALMGTITIANTNFGHEVMITGYNDNGGIQYFDPETGQYGLKVAADFTNLITISKLK